MVSKWFSNRTIIGVICIVLALVLSFLIAPLVNKFADSRCEIIRLTKDVPRGHSITEADIETVTVGSYNLPADVITDKESVIGKFAVCDLFTGEYLLPGKVSSESDSADDVFSTLDGTKQAVSITIASFAGGFSGKLENGDVIRLYVYDGDTDKVTVPPEVEYVRVITTTTADGNDQDEIIRNEDGTYTMPTTITLLVNEYQARRLVAFENKDTVHAALICRKDSKNAAQYLAKQDEFFVDYVEPDESEVIDNG